LDLLEGKRINLRIWKRKTCQGMKKFEGLTLLAKDHRDKYHKGEETFESDANPPNARELLQGALFANT